MKRRPDPGLDARAGVWAAGHARASSMDAGGSQRNEVGGHFRRGHPQFRRAWTCPPSRSRAWADRSRPLRRAGRRGRLRRGGRLASIETQTPLTATDRFRIYSITKTFTAVVILQLVDAGVLTWTTPSPMARRPGGRSHPERRPDHDPPAAHPHQRHLRLLRRRTAPSGRTPSWARRPTGRKSGRHRSCSPTPTAPATRPTSPRVRGCTTPTPATSCSA